MFMAAMEESSVLSARPEKDDIEDKVCRLCDGLPADVMARLHAQKLALCDLLEEVADSLPQDLDHARCAEIAATLEPLMRAVHAYEEEVLFPAYVASQGATPQADELIARLKAEHIEDVDFATELAEGLSLVATGSDMPNADALGYMLRGFFSAVRRHVAGEREAMAPLLSEKA